MSYGYGGSEEIQHAAPAKIIHTFSDLPDMVASVESSQGILNILMDSGLGRYLHKTIYNFTRNLYFIRCKKRAA